MSTALKLRVILDVKEDVFRDIEIKPEQNLEELHHCIVKVFAIGAGEMASFYKSDKEWSQGDEIPFMDMGISKEVLTGMRNLQAGTILSSSSPNLIYVYDFLNMWTFYVEFISEVEVELDDEYPRCTFNYGTTPESAPEKDFSGKAPKANIFGDAFNDDDEEEHYDDDDNPWA